MSTSFKILISISKNDDGSQLFFKMDGERFKYPKTVKFNAETVYKITIRVQPHENIRFVENLILILKKGVRQLFESILLFNTINGCLFK